MNAWLGVVPLTFCLTHAEATVAIVDEERAAVLAPVLPELSAAGCKRVFVVRAKSVPKGMESFEAAVKPFEGKTKPTTTAGIHADEPACIFFTSGTTGSYDVPCFPADTGAGLPKAVISTQRMYLTNFLLTRICECSSRSDAKTDDLQLRRELSCATVRVYLCPTRTLLSLACSSPSPSSMSRLSHALLEPC